MVHYKQFMTTAPPVGETAATVTPDKRERIVKGMRMTSDCGIPLTAGRASPPPRAASLAEVEATHAAGIAEIARRLNAVRAQLDAIQTKTKGRK